MSTRCNVAIVHGNYQIMLYRHCDGWPENLKYDLDRIVSWLKEKRIPEHPSAVASWLILLGTDGFFGSSGRIARNKETGDIEPGDSVSQDSELSPGLYRFTTGIHGDIDFFYVVDAKNVCWRGYGPDVCPGGGRSDFDAILSWHNVSFNKGAPYPEGVGFSSETAQEFQDNFLAESY